MNLEYVASGTAHARITLSTAFEPEIVSMIRGYFDKCQRVHNHDYTVLFNAFTEKNVGKNLYENEMIGLPLHADSGGLQIVTRGLKADKARRNDVYHIQGKYSGIAMSFDEIPCVRSGLIDVMHSTRSRLYKPDLLVPCAKATAQNVVEQIEVFRKNNYKAKPLLIVQGHDLDDFLTWIDVCLKEIPEEMHGEIAGLSFGATSSGKGELEDIIRAWAFIKAECPSNWKNRLHMLGVGSYKRMGPTLAFVNSGLIDTNLSYDSTTHTYMITCRKFLNKEGKAIRYQNFNRVRFMEHFEDIQGYFNTDLDPMEALNALSMTREEYLNKGGTSKIFHESLLVSFLTSMLNMTALVDKVVSTRKGFVERFTYEEKPAYIGILDIKNQSDFDKYLREYGHHLETNKISTETSSLEGFF